MKYIKYIKRTIQLTTAVASFVGLVGCTGFLDESDPSNFTVENYFTKPEHARSSVSAIYANLRNPMVSGFGGGTWMMLEFATGLAGTDLGQAVNSYYVKDLRNTSDNGYGLDYWTTYYKGIGNANLSITYIPQITMDETEKKKILGEAHFLRAFFYFNLVQMFGEIPLVTEAVSLTSEQLYPEQSTVDKVYELIVSDLKVAENSGLPWNDQSGKVNMGIIKSLMAKVYLTMAGYPLNKGAAYFDLSAKASEEVINSKQYQLFPTYADLHDPKKKNGVENIFSIQYKTQVIASNWQVAIIPYNKNISAYSDISILMRRHRLVPQIVI